MMMGCIYAIENANLQDQILTVTVNGVMEELKAIMDGRLDATFLYSNCANEGVAAAMAILRGEEVPKEVIKDPLLIDISNAAVLYVEGRYSPD